MGLLRIRLCTGPGTVTTMLVAKRLEGADMLVFPELVDGGYAALRAGASPHRPGDQFLSSFASASQLSLRTASPAACSCDSPLPVPATRAWCIAAGSSYTGTTKSISSVPPETTVTSVPGRTSGHSASRSRASASRAASSSVMTSGSRSLFARWRGGDWMCCSFPRDGPPSAMTRGGPS